MEEGTSHIHEEKYPNSEKLVREEGIELGVKFGLASSWTSFLAIEHRSWEERFDRYELPRHIDVPQALPDESRISGKRGAPSGNRSRGGGSGGGRSFIARSAKMSVGNSSSAVAYSFDAAFMSESPVLESHSMGMSSASHFEGFSFVPPSAPQMSQAQAPSQSRSQSRSRSPLSLDDSMDDCEEEVKEMRLTDCRTMSNEKMKRKSVKKKESFSLSGDNEHRAALALLAKLQQVSIQ